MKYLELLKKGKISNLKEMAEAYDFLLSQNLKEEEKSLLKKMMYEFKMKFISKMTR